MTGSDIFCLIFGLTTGIFGYLWKLEKDRADYFEKMFKEELLVPRERKIEWVSASPSNPIFGE